MAADPSQPSSRDGPTGDPSAADKLADSQVRGRADFRRCFGVPRPTGVFGTTASRVFNVSRPFIIRMRLLNLLLSFFLAEKQEMSSSKVIYCKGSGHGCTQFYDPRKRKPSSWSGGTCSKCRDIPAASPLSGPRAPDAISPVITASVVAASPSVHTSRHGAWSSGDSSIFGMVTAIYSRTYRRIMGFFLVWVVEQASSQSRVLCVGPKTRPNFPPCQSNYNKKTATAKSLFRDGWRDGSCRDCVKPNAPQPASSIAPDEPSLPVVVRDWIAPEVAPAQTLRFHLRCVW